MMRTLVKFSWILIISKIENEKINATKKWKKGIKKMKKYRKGIGWENSRRNSWKNSRRNRQSASCWKNSRRNRQSASIWKNSWRNRQSASKRRMRQCAKRRSNNWKNSWRNKQSASRRRMRRMSNRNRNQSNQSITRVSGASRTRRVWIYRLRYHRMTDWKSWKRRRWNFCRTTTSQCVRLTFSLPNRNTRSIYHSKRSMDWSWFAQRIHWWESATISFSSFPSGRTWLR